MPPQTSTSGIPLSRRYTITRLNSFLALIQRSNKFLPYVTLYSHASTVAYAALTILKNSPAIHRSVFHQDIIQEEMDRFTTRVRDVNEVLRPRGLHTVRPASDMRDSKTSAVKNLRSFFRDIDKNIDVFTPESAYNSMIVVARLLNLRCISVSCCI